MTAEPPTKVVHPDGRAVELSEFVDTLLEGMEERFATKDDLRNVQIELADVRTEMRGVKNELAEVKRVLTNIYNHLDSEIGS